MDMSNGGEAAIAFAMVAVAILALADVTVASAPCPDARSLTGFAGVQDGQVRQRASNWYALDVPEGQHVVLSPVHPPPGTTGTVRWRFHDAGCDLATVDPFWGIHVSRNDERVIVEVFSSAPTTVYYAFAWSRVPVLDLGAAGACPPVTLPVDGFNAAVRCPEPPPR